MSAKTARRLVLSLVFSVGAVATAEAELHKRVGDIDVYYGLVPAQVVDKHPK
jgi:hypothetical protein